MTSDIVPSPEMTETTTSDLSEMALVQEFIQRCKAVYSLYDHDDENKENIMPIPPKAKKQKRHHIPKPDYTTIPQQQHIRTDVIDQCMTQAVAVMKTHHIYDTLWKNIPIEFASPFFGPGFAFRKDTIPSTGISVSASLIVTHACKLTKGNYTFRHRCTSMLFNNQRVVAVLRIFNIQNKIKKVDRSHQRSMTSQHMYRSADEVYVHMIRDLMVHDGMCVSYTNKTHKTFDIGLEATAKIIALMTRGESQTQHIAHVDFYLAAIDPARVLITDINDLACTGILQPCGFITIKGVFNKATSTDRQLKIDRANIKNALDMKSIGVALYTQIQTKLLVNVATVQPAHIFNIHTISKHTLEAMARDHNIVDKDLLWKYFLEQLIATIRLPNGSLQPYIFEHLLLSSGEQ